MYDKSGNDLRKACAADDSPVPDSPLTLPVTMSSSPIPAWPTVLWETLTLGVAVAGPPNTASKSSNALSLIPDPLDAVTDTDTEDDDEVSNRPKSVSSTGGGPAGGPGNIPATEEALAERWFCAIAVPAFVLGFTLLWPPEINDVDPWTAACAGDGAGDVAGPKPKSFLKLPLEEFADADAGVDAGVCAKLVTGDGDGAVSEPTFVLRGSGANGSSSPMAVPVPVPAVLGAVATEGS
jgi:hypothetical protein